MKNMIKLPVVILGLMLLLTGITQKAAAQDDDISLQSFYEELAPYGTWMQDPQYGYVWRPDVDQSDFRPYYNNGRWAMTEYGNTWVSDYDWGWAPFHYGRWITNRFNQWVWIPDTEWGPAWVSWRSGGGYFGWAPLGPGINININIGGGGYRTPNDWWVFIPQRNIYSDRYSRYTNRRNVTIINQTTIINNTYTRNRNTYYTGPRAADIRRATNRDVTVYNINRSDRPGRTSINNNNINIYNPRGSRSVSPGTNGRDDRNNTPGRGNNYPGQNNVTGDRGTRNVNGQPVNSRPGRTDGNNPVNSTPGSRTDNPGTIGRTDNSGGIGRSSRDGQTPQQQTQRWNQQSPDRGSRNTDGTTPVNGNPGSRTDNPGTIGGRTDNSGGIGRSSRDGQTPQQQTQRWNQQRDPQQSDAVQQQRQQQMQQQRDAQQQQQRDAQQQQQRQQRDAQQQQQHDAQQQQQRQQRDAQQQQQRDAQQQQQRDAQQQQQRQQRDAQQQQQRDAQQQQQRDAQQQQQRQQRDAQQQQQRQQQMQQQRQQHDAQQQQQRQQQMQQQRQQHDAQQQQNRSSRSSENSGENADARRGQRN